MEDNNLNNDLSIHEKYIVTDTIFFSLWELMSLYENTELKINPVYQRFFRWDKAQKSSFIESILLWMPTPSIFVYEKNDWTWELIDWLQRISTILEFFGIIKDEHKTKNEKKSIQKWLIEWKYLKSLKWLTIKNIQNDLSLRIKRHKIVVSVIKRESDDDAKLEIFRRLNTGWTFLSNQEIRNAELIQKNENFYNFLQKLKNNTDFINTVSPSEKDSETEQDTEMVLRYLCVKNKAPWEKIKNVRIFLDEKMLELCWNIDYENEENVFKQTFLLLNQLKWSNVFKRLQTSWENSWRVVSPAFDTIAAWIWYWIDKWNINIIRDKTQILEKINQLWSDVEFNEKTEVWKSSEFKMSFAIKFWKNYFNLNK